MWRANICKIHTDLVCVLHVQFKFPVYKIPFAEQSLHVKITSHLPLLSSHSYIFFKFIYQCHTLMLFLFPGKTSDCIFISQTHFVTKYTGIVCVIFAELFEKVVILPLL